MCTTILCPIYLAFKLGIQLGDILGKYLYSHIISLSFRPSDSYLERCRKAKIREKMTGIVFKDILTYLLFLLIVAKLAYSEKDMNTYYLRQDIVFFGDFVHWAITSEVMIILYDIVLHLLFAGEQSWLYVFLDP